MFTRPRIIPVLLVDDRDLFKTIKFNDRTYLGDPVNAVKIFNRKGIDELAVLDIGATIKGEEPDFELLKDIASEAFMPLACGGGISSVEQIRELLAIGYEKVVLNSSLVTRPGLLKKAAELFGSQSIVASIDAIKINKKYQCAIRSGSELIDMAPAELAREAENLGAGEIIINSIDKDGTMEGYDIELVRMVADSVGIPVTAIGGAAGISDLKKVLQDGHAHAAAAGSMFVFYGRLKAVLITAPTERELIDAGIFTV